MAEFNFFEPYIQVPRKRGQKQYVAVAALGVVAVLIIGYHIYLMKTAQALEVEISTIQTFIDDKKTQQKLTEIDLKQHKIDDMSIFSVYLSDLTLKLSNEDNINSMLFQMIHDQMPKDLFLMEVSIDSGTINMRGYASSYEIVAQYIYNLRLTGVFSAVNVPNIQSDQNGMQFNLIGILTKEGYNENK